MKIDTGKEHRSMLVYRWREGTRPLPRTDAEDKQLLLTLGSRIVPQTHDST